MKYSDLSDDQRKDVQVSLAPVVQKNQSMLIEAYFDGLPEDKRSSIVNRLTGAFADLNDEYKAEIFRRYLARIAGQSNDDGDHVRWFNSLTKQEQDEITDDIEMETAPLDDEEMEELDALNEQIDG